MLNLLCFRQNKYLYIAITQRDGTYQTNIINSFRKVTQTVMKNRNYWSWRKYFVVMIQNLKVLVHQQLPTVPVAVPQLKLTNFM